MKEQIKKLRVKVDGLAQLTKELKPIIKYPKNMVSHAPVGEVLPVITSNSKEIEKAVDSLYLGKAWLGKLLGELGNENPYGSGYKTKEDIVPTQDVAFPRADILTNGFEVFDYENKNHIEKVDFLRSTIEEIVKEVKEIPTKDLSREFAIARTNCYTHLCEARFYLGFELERVRNEQ